MTGQLIDRPPRELAPAGRYPGTVVARQVARRAARSGALWGLIFGFFIFLQTHAYTSTYKTHASRDQLARAYGSNTAMNALLGSERGVNTVAGFADWRFVGILSVLGSIWGLLMSTRLMRGEEEAGRYDLLLAGQTTRRHAAGQALAGLGAGLLALFVLTALGAVVTGRSPSVGFSLGQCLYFSVTLVAGAAMFLAIGALASQLASTRRRATAMAGVVIGLAYALRMVADTNQGLHWLMWLSPLGWIEETKPLTDPDPVALLPVLVLLIAVTAATLHLAGTRDAGAASWPGRDSAQPHLALLGGSAGLAVRLTRPAAIGWPSAVAAFAVIIGTTAESAAKDATGSQGVSQAIGRLGGHGSLVADDLGLTFLILALLIALISAGQITAMRTEEADGYLENLLVRPVSRMSWFAGRLGLSSLVVLAAGLLAGIGAWAGAASQHSGVRFGSLVTAGLNVVPPGLFLLGLGALVLGGWPRRTSSVVYGYLAWSFLVEFAGGVVHTSHWLLDTSVFFHVVPAPATTPDWSGMAVITGLGVLGAVLGGILLCRRDQKNA
ncbi:MAG TPA: ABC transporter permease subunit [Streptosporangiaceae bacterium]|nr:ABC transporter permease subunit [Streptosporangiaceae bacterium]